VRERPATLSLVRPSFDADDEERCGRRGRDPNAGERERGWKDGKLEGWKDGETERRRD
jgi:hypothetical protein